MRRLLLAFAAVLPLGSCSFIAAGTFTECKVDRDCGAAWACSEGYCLPLPAQCVRESLGDADPANDATRIPLLAVLPLHRNTDLDETEVQALNAMKLALSEANAGLDAESRGRFGLFVCDVEADGDAKNAATWFIDNLKVPAILVDGSSNVRDVANAPARIDAGTFIISPNATAVSLSTTFADTGNVWRVAPTDEKQAVVLADLIHDQLPDAGSTKVSIVYPVSEYGNGFSLALQNQLQARGFREPALRQLADDTTNPAPPRITPTDNLAAPQATVLIAFPPTVQTIVTRARQLPKVGAPGHRWYFGDAAKDPAIITTETAPAINGMYGTAPAQGAGTAWAAFRDAFTTRYGQDPSQLGYTSHTYDATWVLLLAAEYAEGKENPDRAAITGPRMGEAMPLLATASGPATPVGAANWQALWSSVSGGTPTNIAGASGPLDFNLDAGYAPSKYEVWRVSGQSIVIDRLVAPP